MSVKKKLAERKYGVLFSFIFSLEHVQEYTKALEESSDEEEEEMPTIQLKSHGGQSPISASDKQSVRNRFSLQLMQIPVSIFEPHHEKTCQF